MGIRVVHGANEQELDVESATVGTLRRSLRDVFNIPDVATALISGETVTDECAVSDGELLEFVQRDGRKGLGELIAPAELLRQWHIDADEYEELLALGLPVLRFRNGTVRHPEAAVDEFFRMQVAQTRSECPQDSLTQRIVVAIEQVADRLPNLAGPPMTVEQVAEFGSVSAKTIYRWVNQGRLKPKADGARPLLFERSEVEKSLSSRPRG